MNKFVLPFGNIKVVIPEVATGNTTFYYDLIFEIIVFHRNALPIPPCPCRKNNLPSSLSNDNTIAEYADLWKPFKRFRDLAC